MRPFRRTFEAKQHAAGSPERARLNLDPRTSEYMPSYRYSVVENDGTPIMTSSFRTKAEAEQWIADKAYEERYD